MTGDYENTIVACEKLTKYNKSMGDVINDDEFCNDFIKFA